jgi:FAD-dependent oxidoreductase family protein
LLEKREPKLGERQADIAIVGGGLGGCAAALAALRLGKQVVMTEETDWLGGQVTAQAVPPDEHPWIEQVGCTPSYRRLRDGIRDYYRRHYPLIPPAREDPFLNPGQAEVSPICHEPRVGLAVLEAMLQPYLSSGQLEVLIQHQPTAADVNGDRVRSVACRSLVTGEEVVLHAPYILDATEFGDLLDLADVEHVIGSECQDETGEPHALPGPSQPLDQQAISWCYALDYRPGEDHTIERPEDYDFWSTYAADFWPGAQLSWTDWHPETLEKRYRPIFDGPMERPRADDLWHFRRIRFNGHYPPGEIGSDISLVNWPQIDYWLGPVVGVTEDERQRHLRGARQLALSMLYWMQTEAPRLEGGYGYPGLRLRPDVVGTEDGLAKHVYVRESRRILSEFTILEQHVGVEARHPIVGAEPFADSVGIGSYRIDLHPGTGLRNYVDVSSYPFQIPLGALIPQRVENLLPAGKNIGTTHITNGCYRLHPVEWNIGEAAGALAACCLEWDLPPRQIRNDGTSLADFQRLLTSRFGLDLSWPEEIRGIAR